MGQLVSEEEVEFYDIAVPDWPGEIDFYRTLAFEIMERRGTILELGCGTGRVTLQLAKMGIHVTGLDLSPSMLAIASKKSQDLQNVHWVEANMQYFELGELFDLIIIPGHSFQFMLTPADQISCLLSIKRHLAPSGTLIIHINHDDIDWLGGLSKGRGVDFELVGEYCHSPEEGSVRERVAWRYEESTQTASAVTAWEKISKDGTINNRKESVEKRLHCFFRFEMEHLLARTGFEHISLFGDFYQNELNNTSPDMIWVARAF